MGGSGHFRVHYEVQTHLKIDTKAFKLLVIQRAKAHLKGLLDAPGKC